jgi:hypothetical protein
MFNMPQGTEDYFNQRGGFAQSQGDAYHIFSGDLCQMGTMGRVLREAGFAVITSGTYPGFPKEAEDEYVRALKYLYDHRVDGWWGQRGKLIEHKVCTEAEFDTALDVECEQRRD